MGSFQNQTEVNAHTDEHGKIIQPNAVPGDFRFRDLTMTVSWMIKIKLILVLLSLI